MADTNSTNSAEYEATFHKEYDYLPTDFDGEFTHEQIYKRDLLQNLSCAMADIVLVLAAEDLPKGSRNDLVRAFQWLDHTRDSVLRKITFGSRLIYFAEYNRPLWQEP